FLLFFFFFSSRRRHTRFSRDWSSDVCSSDLGDISRDDLKVFSKRSQISYQEDEIEAYEQHGGTPFLDGQYTVFGQVIKGLDVVRSEERRVGKECRCRRARYE